MTKSPQTKICTKCNIEKHLNSFYKDKKGCWGVRAKCKICMNAYSKIYRDTHVEQISASKKSYHAIHFKPRKNKKNQDIKHAQPVGLKNHLTNFPNLKVDDTAYGLLAGYAIEFVVKIIMPHIKKKMELIVKRIKKKEKLIVKLIS